MYSLAWSVRSWEAVEGSHDQSAEASFYAGELGRASNGVGPSAFLEKVMEPQTLPTDYTVEGIQAARRDVESLKSLYDAAKSWANLGPFDEYDN